MSKERLFQLALDGGPPVDVTPKDFRGVTYRVRATESEPLSRFTKEVKQRYQVKSPADAANHLVEHVYAPFEEFLQEEFCVLLMNTKNWVTHEVMLYRGTTNSSPIRIGEVFREAVRYNAVAIIIAHNHPTGDPDPSAEDIRVTREIREAGELLSIELLDHIVVGDKRWVSMRERGFGF